MTVTSPHAPKAPFKLACACGEVQILLKGRPAFVWNCYCNDCTASGHFVDRKAKEAGTTNTSVFAPGERASAACGWFLGDMEFCKGQEKLVAFKTSDYATMGRTYASCCNTIIFIAGSESFGNFHVRPLNRNCIKTAEDEDPNFPLMARIMGKFSNKSDWDAKPDDGVPSADTVPFSVLAKCYFAPLIFSWFYPKPGAHKGSQIPGFYNKGAEATDVVSSEDYEAMGHVKPESVSSSFA